MKAETIAAMRAAYSRHVLRMLRTAVRPMSFDQFMRTACVIRYVYGNV